MVYLKILVSRYIAALLIKTLSCFKYILIYLLTGLSLVGLTRFKLGLFLGISSTFCRHSSLNNWYTNLRSQREARSKRSKVKGWCLAFSQVVHSVMFRQLLSHCKHFSKINTNSFQFQIIGVCACGYITRTVMIIFEWVLRATVIDQAKFRV